MDSIVLYTDEIDYLEDAVEELVEQLEGFEFKSNSLGILLAEEDTDYLELYKLLSEKWDFPIIGCTAMAMFNGKDGYCSNGISIMILTADDCRFSVGITDTLSTANYQDCISTTYKDVSAAVDNEEKLIISYGVLVTEDDDVAGDALVNALSTAGNGVPIYGGLASDNFNFTRNRVFLNDTIVDNGLAMALIAGNINPKYICVNSIENRANFSFEITESRSNQVFRLGNGTFVEALERAGVAVDKDDVIGEYLLSPFVVTIKQPDGDTVEAARNLSMLNHERGSGTFLGAAPEGSYLGIGIINREDVQKSDDFAFDEITKLINESDYEYKTFFVTTCAARFLALASNTKAEAEVCIDRLPDGCSLLGMYAFGEFCPTKGTKTGKYYNMFHNFTFTILAI